MNIRHATKADLPIIYEFICGLEEQRFDFDKFAACFDVCFHNSNNHYLIAEIDGKPVGFLSCHGQVLLHHCGTVYELQELYVDAEYRSHGIGRQLVAALMPIIDKQPYDILEVCSNMRRKDAHRFYLNNGFEQTSFKFKKVK